MDNIDKALIGLGILSLGYLVNASTQNNSNTRGTPVIYWPPLEEEKPIKPTKPTKPTTPTTPTTKTYLNKEYEVEFEYPSSWVQTTRNPNKYVGATGFFEIAEVLSNSSKVENVIAQLINMPFIPYGSKPTVQFTTLSGQPAGVIFAKDQNEFFVDRECAVLVKCPVQTMEDGFYRYLIIWTTPDYLPNILNTFKFVKIKR